MSITLTETVKVLDNPYSFRKVRERLHWFFRDRLGEKFEIVYDDVTVVATTRDSYENVKTMTSVINSAYRAGIADTYALLERQRVNES
jgi:hypothetical protein